MLVRLVLLIALAVSLGEVRETHGVTQPGGMSEIAALIEIEATDTNEVILVSVVVVRPISREAGSMPVLVEQTPGARDAGRVFRPPRSALA